MNNQELRNYIRKHGVRHWELAKELGISESTFCRWMRSEFTPEEQEAIKRATDYLSRKEG